MIDIKQASAWIKKAQAEQKKMFNLMVEMTPENQDEILAKIRAIQNKILASSPNIDVKNAAKTLGKYAEEAKNIKSVDDFDKLKTKINADKSKGNKS